MSNKGVESVDSKLPEDLSRWSKHDLRERINSLQLIFPMRYKRSAQKWLSCYQPRATQTMQTTSLITSASHKYPSQTTWTHTSWHLSVWEPERLKSNCSEILYNKISYLLLKNMHYIFWHQFCAEVLITEGESAQCLVELKASKELLL